MGTKNKDKTKHDGESNGEARKKLSRKRYEEKLATLQMELVKLQAWVRYKGLRVVVIFEGRDAAGKGGVIKRITERVSPRVFRTVALPAPSDREKTQIYIQRYVNQLPAAGEVVLFDRSWYNRLGVEHVMGFCTEKRIPTIQKELCRLRAGPGRRRDYADQVLADGEQQRTGAAVSTADRGSGQTVEVEPHGSGITTPLVRLLPRTGCHDGGYRYRLRTVDHRPIG